MNSDQLKQTAHSRRNNAQKVQRPSLKIGDKVLRGSSGGGRSSGIIQSFEDLALNDSRRSTST